jgi:hypothetical protein
VRLLHWAPRMTSPTRRASPHVRATTAGRRRSASRR